MRFRQVSLKQLVADIRELPASWLDARGAALEASIRASVAHLSGLRRTPTEDDLAAALAEIAGFLDVCRLFLGHSQDVLANLVSEELAARGRSRVTWQQLRGMSRSDPAQLAVLLAALDLPSVIQEHSIRQWTTSDVLLERLKHGRGRAIAGMSRGRALEDEIEMGLNQALDGEPVPYTRGASCVGFRKKKAKCDFAIPSKSLPKIVIEAKGFEATGSKQTDVLGDVGKIIEAKSPHTYFFLVTDGRGWHRRLSDLELLVKHHQEGSIDMIFTQKTLPDLFAAVGRIFRYE